MDINIIIRPAEENDLPVIMNLINEFALYLDKSDSVQISLEELYRDQNFFKCYLAETPEGEIIGYALFSYVFHTWAGKSIYIDDLYVKEDFRQCGIGSKLINSIFKLGRQEGCRSVKWQVLDYNHKAIAFYHKIGATVGDNNLNCRYLI